MSRHDIRKGPAKGRHTVVVHLDDDEWATLCERAQSEYRSASSQARWLVMEGLRNPTRVSATLGDDE